MRNLKLRAWDKEFNLMSVVTRLDYWSEIVEMSDGELYIQKLDKVELMSSTGLFDKKGVEIFEGDIVKRYRNPLFKAKWEYQIETVVRRKSELLLGRYIGNNCMTISFGLPFTKSDLLEVIGNIYENSELLEGE